MGTSRNPGRGSAHSSHGGLDHADPAVLPTPDCAGDPCESRASATARRAVHPTALPEPSNASLWSTHVPL
jgi:hypothetical protein